MLSQALSLELIKASTNSMDFGEIFVFLHDVTFEK